MAEDLSGDFRSLIVGIINGGRDESEEVDSDKVQEDAKVRMNGSQSSCGNDEFFIMSHSVRKKTCLTTPQAKLYEQSVLNN